MRTLFSVIAVLVLVFVGYLVYCSLSERDKADAREALESLEQIRPALPRLTDSSPAKDAPRIKIDTTQPPPPPVVQVKDAGVAPPPVDAPRGKRTHVVRAGETLWSISKDYFGSSEYHGKIAEANNLKEKDRIRIGQVLVIPNIPNVKRLEVGTEDHTETPPTAQVPEAPAKAPADVDVDADTIPPTLDMRVRK